MRSGFGWVRLLIAATVVLAAVTPLHSQQIDDLEFVNAPVRDIFAALGSVTGNSVIPDETVTGTASFYFTDTNFESAIAVLASRFNLFVTEAGSVFNVSAIRVSMNEHGRLTVDAPSIDVGILLRRLSQEAKFPVLFDRLPAMEITYHVRDAALPEILAQIASQLPDHEVITESGAFVLQRPQPGGAPSPGNPTAAGDWIVGEHDRYTVSVRSAGFTDLVSRLFAVGGREYQLLKRGSPTVTDLSFSDKLFDDLLTLICERGDAQYAVVEGIYYISDAAPLAALARAQQTVIIRPDHLPIASLMDALPPEQTAGAALRPDRAGNALSITGIPSTVDRIVSLIREIDVRPSGRDYHRFAVNNLSVSALPSLLPRHLSGLSITPLPDGASFITLATEEQAEDLDRFLSMIDLPPTTVPITLEHVQLRTLTANLPASASPGSIVSTGDPTRFFFRGTTEELDRFLIDLETIDRPLPQIRYQLLVIQYEDGTAREFAFDLSNAISGPDSVQSFLGSVGNLLSLNFDVIAAFGYQFAARLNAQIANSAATVLVDTTLSALSGQSARFQSTSTYRYRDSVADLDTGEIVPTGVIREITSGLILTIAGWVSGGDVVTMDVSATLSKRGTDSSDGNPPRTSEKVVDTHIRTASGEPVVLSGLVQQEMQRMTAETPLLARIPLIGFLFQKRDETVENTELAIYIIPHVERLETGPEEVGARLMELYDTYGRSRQ